ncbi:magnesium-translocating P-type ATPase, partial [Schumannella luteola]
MDVPAAPEPLRGRGDALEAYWSLTPARVRALLGAPADGLDSADAAERLIRYGPNQVDPRRRHSGWRLLARQFLNPIEIILVIATVLAGFLGDWTDSGIILVIILASGVLGFVQEQNAGRAVEALLASVEASCTVRRDATSRSVPVARIVPGDLVLVRAGDLIPGDCVVVTGNGLTVDESALTGETFPAEKRPEAVPPETPLGERVGVAHLGTHVASGSGSLLVVHTGSSTE